MRIGYISYEFPPETGYGGIGTYTMQVSAALAAKGHHVEVFSCSHTEDRFNILLESGVLLHRVKAARRKEFSFRLLDIFSERHGLVQFDLVESPEYGAEGLGVKQQFPELTMVVKLHSPVVLINTLNKQFKPVSLKTRIKKWVGLSSYDKYIDPDFRLTAMADAVCAPSAALASWIKQIWAISKIDIIPNVFNPSPELLQIPVDYNTKRVTFFGKLNVLKGMVTLTKAIPLVLKKHPDAVFRFIGFDGEGPKGEPSMKGYMLAQLNRYSHALEFTGFAPVGNIPGMLENTAIVVLPSLWENYPNACLEAMSAGKPVVGSAAGGMKEILEHGKGGFIVDPFDHKAISAALNRLLDDPGLCMRMGMVNRQRVVQLAAFAEQTTIAYYATLIAIKAHSTHA